MFKVKDKPNFRFFFLNHDVCVSLGVAAARGPDQKPPASPGCRPQWCCHCKVVVLGNGVQKSIKDIPSHLKVRCF